MTTFTLLQSLHANPIRHHDRGLTLVFGSDGQASLIGLDSGLPSQAPYTPTVRNTGTLSSDTPSLPSGSASSSRIPNLEATSASLTGSSSSILAPTTTFTPTSFSSSLASSSYDPSSAVTDTDTNLPSVPTMNYPTPSPTSESASKDHGVGAPFYLAIVIASISFVGCVAAFIAWWIRSRSRRRDLEYDDPWDHTHTLSGTGSPSTGNAHAREKGNQSRAEAQTLPSHLPTSIAQRSSSNLYAVPRAIPTSKGGILRNGNASSSQSCNPYLRPGAERLQTGLSVQESTRTLGTLHVTNRVPGDVTSGDEGGMNLPRLRNNAPATSSAAITGGPDTALVGVNATQNIRSAQNHRTAQKSDAPLEPPGPATFPWGRRMDTVAALRRTRRRTPVTTVQMHENESEKYLNPPSDGGSSGVTLPASGGTGHEENGNIHANPQSDSPGWSDTIKSSFWQAVDVVKGSRPPDVDARVVNGSGFTPAPRRVASRRPPISSNPPSASSVLPGNRLETETQYDPTLSVKSPALQGMPRSSTYPNLGDLLTERNETELTCVNEVPLARIDSTPPRVSRLNRNLSESTSRHPDSLRTDTGSVYSTESAAARANLRKYGYGDSIPSSWSALDAARESQLDLDRVHLPLPRPISSSPRPLSRMPSQLILESVFLSSSVSARTRARIPMHSEVEPEHRSNEVDHGETPSMYSVSRNSTMQSRRGTIDLETRLSHSSSTPSMLSRKKGITTRRKRPRMPPRASSTASSVQSVESGLSAKELVVRKALLERRKKIKAAESLKGREDKSNA